MTKVTGAVLVSLTIREFGTHKRDDGASLDVTSRNQADVSAARVWKTLLPKGSVIDDVRAALGAIRSFHYKNTHAYVHDGPRILPTKNYQAYQQGMRLRKEELEKAVLTLEQDYEVLKEAAKQKLGALYDERDYPPVQQVRQAYQVATVFSPMPATEMLMDLGLETKEMEEMRSKLESELQDAFQSANRKMWLDLHSKLEVVIDQMASEKGNVHPKTLESIASLIEMLPRLNVTNDAALDAMAARLSTVVQSMSSPGFRHSEEAKTKAVEEARSVFGVMSSFMKARQQAPSERMEMKVA